MNRFKTLFGGTALFACLLPLKAAAQIDLQAQLPIDPTITVKTLSNGLRYYIRENQKPENRARFRLVVNAGSLMETEAQRGLAHFLEHMAFNGTENFEKLELVNFLERIGMTFGSHLNAYTSFGETVYMLEIPVDDSEVLETAFQVLKDWMQGIQFEPEEIDKERGVVIEEWRSGRGAQGRLNDKQVPIIFHGSRYAERLPIGKVEIIQNAPREQFIDFYRKWYRPNLMALIAVGDFETAEIERRILDSFSELKNPPDAPKRQSYPVPDHQETLFSIETDPELQATVIQIAYKRPPTPQGTAGAYRDSIIESLYTGMLNLRLNERVQEANPPYLYGAIAKAPIVRTKDVVIQIAQVKDGAFEEGLKALLLEAKRAKQDGFTAAELRRIKAVALRSMEMAYAERDKTNSGAYTAEYTRHFLQQEPIPGIAKELELYRAFLPGIRLEEVNQAAADWITPHNRIILFSAPEKKNLAIPAKEDILKIIENVEQLEIAAYDDGDLDAPLIPSPPTPGTVTAQKRHPKLGLTEWKLSNGIRILLKPTDFKNDQILLSTFSPGGHSLVSDTDFPSASIAASLVANSGLGTFDRIQLQKKLAGKIAAAVPQISERTEGISGSASPKDLETMLQLVHLYFTAPRADRKTFQSMMAQLNASAANRLNNPQTVFSDAIQKALYRNHPRHQPLNQAFLDKLDLQKAFAIYCDRFLDASDFTFILVGNFTPDILQPLAETYLASLPNRNRREKAKDPGDTKTKGKITVQIEKGLEPKSTVRLTFHGPAPWSPEERFALLSTIDILQIRLREVLREDKGGVYGVGIYGGLNRWPQGHYANNIAFGCNPGKAHELIAAALATVEELKTQGPSQDNLDKIKENNLRNYERSLKENTFWLNNLAYAAQNQLPFTRILTFPQRVAALTPARIQQAAQKYFSGDNLLTATLFPEQKSGQSQKNQQDLPKTEPIKENSNIWNDTTEIGNNSKPQ